MKKSPYWKSLWRFIFAAMAVYALAELIGYFAAWLVAKVFGGLSFSVPHAAAVGIIGGADGPTAIFVTASAAPVWKIIWRILLLAVGVWGFLRMGCGQKK